MERYSSSIKAKKSQTTERSHQDPGKEYRLGGKEIASRRRGGGLIKLAGSLRTPKVLELPKTIRLSSQTGPEKKFRRE